MPFSNLEYLYEHLPAHYRRDDSGLFLKRFLTFFGEQLDDWDATLDNFGAQIAPETASAEFIEWWLFSLFDWSWFPDWFTLANKRALYAHLATHYAARGTARGIENFLREFGVQSRVFAKPAYSGEYVWNDAPEWSMTDALEMVVQVHHLADPLNDASYYDGFAWGESYCSETQPLLTKSEIEMLLRYQQPFGQKLYIEYLAHAQAASPIDYFAMGQPGYEEIF